MAFDWSGTFRGLMQGAGLAAPLAVGIIVHSLGTTPQEAQTLINTDPARAQQIVEQAPPEVIQQVQQEQQTQPPSQPQEEQQTSSLISAEQLAPFIAQWEGKRSRSYPDADSRSVGYGYYLGNAVSRGEIESVGANFDAVYNGTQGLSDQQMERLLQITSQRAIDDAVAAVPDLGSHPQQVQMLIADMAHTLGPKLKSFPKLLDALKRRDYGDAAREMQDSKWFNQTGRRGVHHVQMMSGLDAQ